MTDLTSAQLISKIQKLEVEVEKLTNEAVELRAAATAYQEFNICYRLDKPPSEDLWKRLTKAERTLAK